MIYAVIGAGPTAERDCEAAADGADVVIVCNAAVDVALDVLKRCDVIVVVERDAVSTYLDRFDRAVRAYGAKLVMSPNAAGYFRSRLIRRGDPLKYKMRYSGPHEYVKDKPLFATCGAVAFQYAVDQGATEVRIAGCTGYTEIYWSKKTDKERRLKWLNNLQWAVFEFMARDCPEVAVLYYGEPVLPLPERFVQK